MNQTLFSRLPSPLPFLQACVAIPARDESEGIVATLDALARQRDTNGQPLEPSRFEILLLANNCCDDTVIRARRWSREHPSINLHVVEAHFSQEEACVGYARRLLMDAACARLLHHRTAALPNRPRAICSTDADTRVSPFWIAHTLEEMSAGARAVGGRIFLKREDNDPTRRTYLFDTAYRLLSARLQALLDPRPGDPGPRHFQFFGASMALCPHLYAQVGGLPHVRCLEDVALEQQLSRMDQDIRHSPHVTVWTSARRDGRVETGLSTQLQEWNEISPKHQWMVPSASEIALKAQLQRRLRSYWRSPSDPEELSALAQHLFVTEQELEGEVQKATYFGELWEKLRLRAWNDPRFRVRFAPIPVSCALAQLRQMLEGVTEK